MAQNKNYDKNHAYRTPKYLPQIVIVDIIIDLMGYNQNKLVIKQVICRNSFNFSWLLLFLDYFCLLFFTSNK